jgi:putative methionine-R-sulfoxide reductase with GAF domain
MLDQLKADQPEQYAEIMAQLQASASGAENGVSEAGRTCGFLGRRDAAHNWQL